MYDPIPIKSFPCIWTASMYFLSVSTLGRRPRPTAVGCCAPFFAFLVLGVFAVFFDFGSLASLPSLVSLVAFVAFVALVPLVTALAPLVVLARVDCFFLAFWPPFPSTTLPKNEASSPTAGASSTARRALLQPHPATRRRLRILETPATLLVILKNLTNSSSISSSSAGAHLSRLLVRPELPLRAPPGPASLPPDFSRRFRNCHSLLVISNSSLRCTE